MPDEKYMLHVGDLEEWNEDWHHDWLPPTLVRSGSRVVVIHPFEERVGINGGGTVVSTVIAVYTVEGERDILQVLGGHQGENAKPEPANYWSRAAAKGEQHAK